MARLFTVYMSIPQGFGGQMAGQLGSVYKTVVIKGTATLAEFPQLYPGFAQSTMDSRIRAAGYGLNVSRVAWAGWLPGDRTVTVELEINALREHSGEWVKNQMYGIISSIHYETIATSQRMFKNLTLTVASDPGTSTTDPQQQITTDPVQQQQQLQQNNQQQPAPFDWNNLLKGFGEGLGGSTPLLLVGGLALILLARR